MFSNFVTYATEQIPFILDQRKKNLVVMPHSDKAWHKGHIWVKNSCIHNTGPEKDFKIYSCHVRNTCHVRNK